MNERRRILLRTVPLTAMAGMIAIRVRAENAHLTEDDKQALALAYAEDATKVDGKKHPEWASGRTCGNCQLFGGKNGDAWGSCILMGDKLVSGKGWCSAWEQG